MVSHAITNARTSLHRALYQTTAKVDDTYTRAGAHKSQQHPFICRSLAAKHIRIHALHTRAQRTRTRTPSAGASAVYAIHAHTTRVYKNLSAITKLPAPEPRCFVCSICCTLENTHLTHAAHYTPPPLSARGPAKVPPHNNTANRPPCVSCRAREDYAGLGGLGRAVQPAAMVHAREAGVRRS